MKKTNILEEYTKVILLTNLEYFFKPYIYYYYF